MEASIRFCEQRRVRMLDCVSFVFGFALGLGFEVF